MRPWAIVALCTIVLVASLAARPLTTLDELAARVGRLDDRMTAIEARMAQLERARLPGQGDSGNRIIELSKPRADEVVNHLVIVEGRVHFEGSGLAGRTPVILVHPLSTDVMWIQAPCTVERINDTEYGFRGRAYCGSAPEADAGQRFEIIAVLAPSRDGLGEREKLAVRELDPSIPRSSALVVKAAASK